VAAAAKTGRAEATIYLQKLVDDLAKGSNMARFGCAWAGSYFPLIGGTCYTAADGTPALNAP
jgi:hypothetical protein